MIDDFFRAIWGDLNDGNLFGELRLIRDGKIVQTFARSATEAALAAVDFDKLGNDVYFGVMPRTTDRGRAEDCRQVGDVLWIDLDGKSFGGGKAEAFTRLSFITVSPQIVVDSGHGYHAYWLLDDLYPFSQLQQAMKGLEIATGADHCSDQARILRVPGTHNHKNGERVPVRILRFNLLDRRHPLYDFADYADLAAPRTLPKSYEWDDSGWELSSPKAPKFPEGTRNQNLTRLAGAMVTRGLSYEEMLVHLGYENQMRCDPPLPDREVVGIVRSTQRYRRG